MNPRNLTREAIEELNDIEPYCFETDREEQWFNIGLQYGLDVADSNPISPWINVKEDLPCNHKELLRIDNKQCSKTFKVFVTNIYGENWSDYMIYKNGKWRWNSYEPDYWMIPPKLPKE